MFIGGAARKLLRVLVPGVAVGLLDDVLAWSAGLPAWQRDALRRLFRNGQLGPADLVELTTLIKEEHGDGTVSSVRPTPLLADDIPAGGTTAVSVQLLAINNLLNVNRFPAGRSVDFSPEGLNVLFGENGAGKSGYARVLKNACRARVRHPVLADAFDATRPRPVPSADITFSVDGDPVRTTWQQGAPSDPALGNVTVYDSACGNDYVTNSGNSDYQPFGLPHLNRLVVAQQQIAAAIQQEKSLIQLNPQVFADLHGEHEVGTLLRSLGRATDVARLRTLATLSAQDLARIEELAQVLGTMNPEPEATSATVLAQRLDTAATAAQQAHRFVTDAALDEVQARHQGQQSAQAAWVTAQNLLHKNSDDIASTTDLLPGTGNDVWKSLFQAAEKFSTQYAYTSHEHLNVEVGAKCVLCQTPLDEDASDRMRRFAAYVVDNASTNAEATARRMSETMEKIQAATLDPVDTPTLTELAIADPELHDAINATTTIWKERRQWVEACVERGDWMTPRPIQPEGDSLDVRLRAKAQALRTHAETLRQSVDPAAKAVLEKERAALMARQGLSQRLQSVEQYVVDATRDHHLGNCLTALNARRVSTKMTELAGTYVNAALANAMNAELKALGYRRSVEPVLTIRTDAGTTMMTLRIKDTQDNASEVLSEGELRAMGLALFLAEIQLQDHRSSVVFDDPSTSFDHHRRRHIANRFAELALERQVLILTHDAVFLAEINAAVKRSEQPVLYQTVGWHDNRPGHVGAGLTWETMDAAARLADLEQSAAPLRQHEAPYLDEATKEVIKKSYTKLRGAIERSIREVFLNNTVRPFSDEISVDSFGAVIGHPQEEWDKVSEIYARCCEVTDAHDTNAEHQLTIPDPSILIQDIDDLKDLHAKAKQRQKAYNTDRSNRNQKRKAAFVA